MRVLTIINEADAGPGVFLDALSGTGAMVDTWLPPEQAEPPAPVGAYDAILGFGGSANPDQDREHPWLTAEKRLLAEALRERVPMLGVCLGAELIAAAEGAGVRRIPRPEIGWYDVTLTAAGLADPVLGPVGRSFSALEWHSYEAVLPARATALARSDSSLQAYRIGGRAWGIQFHAEVTSADFHHWLDTYTSFDEDAIKAGIDVDAIATATDERIEAWNDVGRGICERFLQVASHP
ncbi:MAG TPA: type 1 glutamine amidotransferase [Solirubrobacteraceae bacterium]|nr:type 1 glutamine amidotransferase [Solirubrobacteraceae bacterium]